MILPGRPCPFNDGRHQPHPWTDVKELRSGFACVKCSKTWEWKGETLEATYGD